MLKFTLHPDEASDLSSSRTKQRYKIICLKSPLQQISTGPSRDIRKKGGIQQLQQQYTLLVDHNSSTDRRHDKERSKFLLSYILRLFPDWNQDEKWWSVVNLLYHIKSYFEMMRWQQQQIIYFFLRTTICQTPVKIYTTWYEVSVYTENHRKIILNINSYLLYISNTF